MDFIRVTVIDFPGVVKDVALNGDRTVRTAIELAGVDSEGKQVQISGQRVSFEHELEDGDTVMVLKKITGNG